jgi:hypothetical protein
MFLPREGAAKSITQPHPSIDPARSEVYTNIPGNVYDIIHAEMNSGASDGTKN